MTTVVEDPAFEHIERPHITFDTEEGDVEIKDGQLIEKRGDEKIQEWTAEILKNAFLIISAATDWTVKIAPGGTQPLLGVAWKRAETGTSLKTLPDENQTISPGPARQVSVELYGGYTRVVPMGTSGAAAVRGDSIQPHSSEVNVWEGAGSLNNDTYCLVAAAVGAGNFCVALFDFHGDF